MNVCRVLPNGSAAKLAVDEAIDLCTPIGAVHESHGPAPCAALHVTIKN